MPDVVEHEIERVVDVHRLIEDQLDGEWRAELQLFGLGVEHSARQCKLRESDLDPFHHLDDVGSHFFLHIDRQHGNALRTHETARFLPRLNDLRDIAHQNRPTRALRNGDALDIEHRFELPHATQHHIALRFGDAARRCILIRRAQRVGELSHGHPACCEC